MTVLSPLRVLVVGSEPAGKDDVSVNLRHWGNDVRTVFGRAFPMEEAHGFAPDLVLVHIGGPQFDALNLVKHFRRRHIFGSVPLVALLSECDAGSQSLGISAGFDAWLVKPIASNTLAGLLSDVREVISMPGGLVQQTIDQVDLFDALKLEKDNQKRIDRLSGN